MRCPYCGDSQKHSFKARGFIYFKGENAFYICHNCDKGTTLQKLIQFIDPSLVKEYILENFKENSATINTEIIYKSSIPKFKERLEAKLKLPTIAS